MLLEYLEWNKERIRKLRERNSKQEFVELKYIIPIALDEMFNGNWERWYSVASDSIKKMDTEIIKSLEEVNEIF